MAELAVGLRSLGGPEYCFGFFAALFRLFYDAVYFHIVSDSTFVNWCGERNVDALCRCFQCCMEDVEHVSARSANYWSKLDLMVDSFYLLVNISIEEMLRSNKIVLCRTIDDVNRAFNGLDSELVALWEERGFGTTE